MQNKPNSKPNKPNFKIGKMNITSAITVNYINELRTTNYELIMKTNPNKPNQACPRMSQSGTQFKLEAQRRSLWVSSLESSNQGPIKANEIFTQDVASVSYCSFLVVCLGGPKQINEIRIKAPPEKKSNIRWRGSLQRVSHSGIAGSTNFWFGSATKTLLAMANCSGVALG